jgi:uncharacterized phiE125 gp8 family phage protein
MNSGLQIITPPATSLLTPADLKDQLRIQDDDLQTSLVQSYIDAALEYIEIRTQHCFKPVQYLYVLDRWPYLGIDGYLPLAAPTNGIITLPRAPLVSVDEIKYTDTDVVLRTLDPSQYLVQTTVRPGRIWPARFAYWPITDPLTPSAVQIKFTAGYSSDGLIPKRAYQCLRFLVAHWFENRVPFEDTAKTELPVGLQALIRSLRITGYVA